MQHKSDRRILTSFVVRPCESASPAALLRALVQLCRTIRGYQVDILGPNKRIAREIIRQVGILLLFLEEIQEEDGVAALPGSVVLCFSELYLILQKLRCVLEDCAREGARVWMVMHSPLVASDFRALIRSVATILDVLPLDSIKVSVEVRDFIELLRRQVWKVRIEVEPRDEVARKSVLSILDQFEKGVVPDSSDLNWVLDHLEIRSWIDCNKEIKFLEEEIELENSKGKERDIVFLSSLLGFMNYCRGVMFDVVDGENSNKLEGRFEGDVINHLNLDDFRCPISLELMMEPVTVSTGHTYDRVSIEKWLRAGNLTCPKTGGKLMNAELVPNSALHKIIQQFCCEKGTSVVGTGSRKSRDSSRTHLAVNSPAAMGATRILSDFLVEKLSVGSEKERGKAAYEVRLLTKFSSFNRASLVEAGSILWLLNLLSCSDPLTQENSVAALLNLSKHPKGKTVIVETGGLGPILDVLRSGLKIESQQNAAAILFYLSSVDEYREMIGEIPEAIPALVRLLKSGTNRGKKVTVVALFGILLFHKNLPRVINAGAVPSLIDLLSSERSDLVNDTLAVLAALAEKPEGASEILKASAIPLLMHILQSSPSKSGKKYCVSILHSLCINGGAEVVSTLKKMPLTMASLYSLLTDGTPRGSKKASSLLSLLHDWPIPNSILAQPVQQDWAVHVQ